MARRQEQLDAYTPGLTAPQWDAVFAPEAEVGFVGGYASGKTEALFWRAMHLLLRDRKPIGVFAPTANEIHDTLIPRFEAALDRLRWPYRPAGQQRPQLRIAGMPRIVFRSMERPDRLVGFEIGHALIDEADLARDPLLAYQRITARARMPLPEGRRNTLAMFGTPEGFGLMHRVFVRENRGGLRRLVQAGTWTNPTVTRDYIERLLATYPQQLIAAYLGGKFVNLNAGAVHPQYDREKNDTDRTMPDDGPVRVFLDFNYGNMCGGEFTLDSEGMFVTGEISAARDTPAVIELLNHRWPGRQIIVYPDAAGAHRDTRGGALTDHALLASAGYTVKVAPANPPIKDRILSVNAGLLNGEGRRWLRVNQRAAPDIAHALEAQVYDKNGMPEKGGAQDVSHWTEPLGYAVHAIAPAVRPSSGALGSGVVSKFMQRRNAA